MSSGMVTEQQPAPGPNGTPSPSGQGRSSVASRMESRAALLASLEKGEDAANDSASPEASGEGSASSAAVPPSAAADAEPPGKQEATKPGDKPDAETEKRLAKVQDAEKRSREKLAAEKQQLEATKAEIEKAREELKAAREEVAQFAKLKERAKLDPAAALKALGVEDLEYAAKQAYAQSKAKADDPANREAAARQLRERELADEVAELKKWRAEREQREKQQAEQATVQKQAEEYMSGVMKAAASNPLAKHFIDKAPQKVDRQLRQIAYDLARELDDVPDAEDVIARFEKIRREEAAEYGLDIDKLISPATASTKKNEQSAEKKNAAPTLSNDLSTPRVPRANVSERERRKEVLSALESGNLD